MSDAPLIRDIFRFKLWEMDEGLDYLLGIFKTNRLPDGTVELHTLDGRCFNSSDDQALMDEIFSRHDRLAEIWNHSAKKSRYSPGFFVRWGLQHRDICKLSWLDDALNKGLLQQPVEKAAPLHHSEKSSLLRIIAGLTVIAYKKPSHGLKAEIRREFEQIGLEISENTLNKHLENAWSEFIDKSKPH